MAFWKLTIGILFLSVSFYICIYGKKFDLSPFGKKVKELLPNATYEKVFSLTVGSDDEVHEAVKTSIKSFFNVLGVPFNKSFEEKLEQADKKDFNKHPDPEEILAIETYIIQKVLEKSKNITFDEKTIDDLAPKYVDQLNKVAKPLKTDADLTTKLTAKANATALFLKSEDAASKKDAEIFEKIVLDELDE